MSLTSLRRVTKCITVPPICYRCPLVHSLPAQASSSSHPPGRRQNHSGPIRQLSTSSSSDSRAKDPASTISSFTSNQTGINLNDEISVRRRFIRPSPPPEHKSQGLGDQSRVDHLRHDSTRWQGRQDDSDARRFAPRSENLGRSGGQDFARTRPMMQRKEPDGHMEYRPSYRSERVSTPEAKTNRSGPRGTRQDTADRVNRDRSLDFTRKRSNDSQAFRSANPPPTAKYQPDPNLDLSRLPKLPEEKKRLKVGWSGISFEDMLPHLAQSAKIAKGSTNFLIKAARIESLPVPRPPPFPPHLLRKRTEDKVVKFGFMATISTVSKKACVRRRAMRRLKSAIDLAVNRDIGVPPGEKGFDLVVPELAYLAQVNKRTLEAPIEELCAEAATALITIRNLAQSRPPAPRRSLPKWKTENLRTQ